MPSAFDGYYPDGYDDGDQSGTHAGTQPRVIKDGVTVTAEDLIPLFRDAASVNMTEEAVERQAKRFAEAVLLMFDVRRFETCQQCSAVDGSEHHPECMYYVAPQKWEIGKNGWDASDEVTREDI